MSGFPVALRRLSRRGAGVRLVRMQIWRRTKSAGHRLSTLAANFRQETAMKFSLIYEAQTTDATRAGDRKVFDDTVEQVLLAEQMGFDVRSEEHTSELQSLMRISYAVFCLKKKKHPH